MKVDLLKKSVPSKDKEPTTKNRSMSYRLHCLYINIKTINNLIFQTRSILIKQIEHFYLPSYLMMKNDYVLVFMLFPFFSGPIIFD